MEIFKQIAPLRAFLKDSKKSDGSIGLVPTMGALHNGHLTLIEASKSSNSLTVASIYVNPTQFNNPDDLRRYPKSLDRDVELLQMVGCDVVFCPDDTEMYASKSTINFDFGPLGEVMEGKFRPGHFNGVALVVSKLFNIIEPDFAYFGQKDWQQFAVINKLVDELKFNLRLQSVPIVREPSGLALSSRNFRLTAPQRQNASIFHSALQLAANQLTAGAELKQVKMAVRDLIEKTPEMRLQYFELANRKNLNIMERVEPSCDLILCIAGFAGEVRLIDNMFLD